MQNNLYNFRYWIIAGIISLAAVIILYRYSTFDSLKMEISRSNAINIAQDFLKGQNVSLEGYYSDVYNVSSSVQVRYILSTLKDKGFKEVIDKESWPVYGWNVIFFDNLPKDQPQTIYAVGISPTGRITAYHRSVPDTMFLPSVSRDSATKFITHYLKEKGIIDLSDYKLVETKEDNFSKRNDFTFLWEKESKDVRGKLTVKAKVQGNQPGSFEYNLEVPSEYKSMLDTENVILSTISIIFVFFLSQFAVVLFLRKYHQGEIWIKLGVRIILVYIAVSVIGIINAWPAYGHNVVIGNLSYLMVKIVSALTGGMLLSVFLAILLFVAWAVGESYARELWPARLKSADAFITGRYISLPSGISLFKGMIIGTSLALVYLLLVIVINKVPLPVYSDVTNLFNFYESFSPAIESLTSSFANSLLVSIVMVFFIVNTSYQKWKKKWLSILLSGLVTTLCSAIGSNIPSAGNISAYIVISFLYGCLFAYIYLLFDLLTLFSALFYSSMIVNMYTLAASDASFYKINYYMLIAAYLITPAIFIAALVRKEDFVLEAFGLPSHIQRISERERLKKEMEIAAKMQLSLLPKEQPCINGYDIAGISIPAKEAGGDYYDFIKLADNKLGVAIGDVSGKGVGAAIYMTLTKGIFQAHAEENISPKQVLGKVNQLLYKTIEKNSFVSMIYSILDINSNTMVYSRAGQNPGIFCSNDDGNTKLLTSNGIALGLDSGGIFNKVLIEEKINLCPGDLVVFYTDGFTEAMNEWREEFGEERLKCLIQDNRQKPAKEIINLILKEIKSFVDVYPQHDDMTIVIIKRN
ncbi:MAG: PP2C family protein-serine/threonine phosphatase [Bacillota bacterium]